ncbi:hypothetical protein RMCBS344292_06302 [Rhizopus microsporus]|nr:hypothetical protein RMCBS344292_06302 [Rhizopus microsporus]
MIQESFYRKTVDEKEPVCIWLEELKGKNYSTFKHSNFENHFTFGFSSPWQKQLLLNSTMICLDATHCVSHIQRDIMHTIVARHPATSTGCPVAYMFTEDHSMAAASVFLSFVKNDIGVTTLEKITIDVSTTEHAAITAVYPEAAVQWCLFHVSHAWMGKIREQQQQQIRLPIMSLANKATNGIINHTLFDEIVFEEEEEEENIEVRNFGNLNQLYNQIRLIYEAEFRGIAYNSINDYGYATNHPLKFIRLSHRLLQAASSLPNAPIKLWSLLSQATHSMVHMPLSGIPTLYTLFQRAHQNGHPVPRFMIPNDNFFRPIDFDRFYFGHENKAHLWNTVFNIGKVDTGVLANLATSHLAYSTKTDGHMISILFEKTFVEFITQAKNDLIRQKRNIGFANRTKGLYPLYKEPTGITANDRIIGIDPGVRDIIYAIDCDADELVDK